MTTQDVKILVANADAVARLEASQRIAGRIRAVQSLRNAWRNVRPMSYAEVAAIAHARNVDENRRLASHAKVSGFLDTVRAMGAERGELREFGNPAQNATVWTTGDVSKPVNPFYDAAQRTFERNESHNVTQRRETVRRVVTRNDGTVLGVQTFTQTKTRETAKQANVLTKALQAFGNRVYLARIARNKVGKDITHLRDEIIEEAISALLGSIARDANPVRTLARFTLNPVDVLTVEKEGKRKASVHACAAHKAIDSLLYRMSKENASELAYFDGYDAEFFAPDTVSRHAIVSLENVSPFHVRDLVDVRELNRPESETLRASDNERIACVNTRCDELLANAREKLVNATSNRERGSIRAAMGLVERAREFAHAAIAGERFALKAPLSWHAEKETVTYRLRNGGQFAGNKTATVETGRIETRSSLWKRAKRLGDVLGVKLV